MTNQKIFAQIIDDYNEMRAKAQAFDEVRKELKTDSMHLRADYMQNVGLTTREQFEYNAKIQINMNMALENQLEKINSGEMVE